MLSNTLLSFLSHRRLCLPQSQWGCASGTSTAMEAYQMEHYQRHNGKELLGGAGGRHQHNEKASILKA